MKRTVATLTLLGTLLALPAFSDEPFAAPYGTWLAEDIGTAGVVDTVQTTLNLSDDGRATGSGGCNRFTGTVTVTETTIEFGPLAGTKMACPEAVMNQENKFHNALSQAAGWQLTAADKLELTDETGKTLVVFARHTSQ
ncbi:META domain-containing protein [Aureimonas fodinaquatilis]|uniref:META domain-containing protein n=1 Tax=Aureimonas fodinaquatilis TaxID=2565783 RepID=A0A5B0DT42_9HYPH|nr:META domain-containing protein [Aureimonas fodinaquatilis]KAA0968931.1 META domain-containing protein [Aureimonas fodinaquatilis]